MAKAKKLTASEMSSRCILEPDGMETIICDLYRDSDQAKLYFNSLFNSEELQEEVEDCNREVKETWQWTDSLSIGTLQK
ncbi:MAG: hypothetical protein LUI39_11175 [Lachnospiraceae bacterium]|nr:hypothetical protein [Lachnospiraceae bacterium]